MKKAKSDELRPEYHREDLGPGVRGKYFESYQKPATDQMTFKDFTWAQEGGRWEWEGENVVLQSDESEVQPTRFFCKCGLPAFEARLKATLLRACGEKGWGEIKFVFSDARSSERLRVDFMIHWHLARITCGGIQYVQPLFFSIGQPLNLHIWCDGSTVTVKVDDLPLFERVLFGKHSDGWIGIGTFMALARFSDLELKRYSPRMITDDLSGIAAGIKVFNQQYDFDTSVFVMMRFKPNIPQLKKVYEVIRTELAAYGLNARKADEADYHDELWNNVRVYMNGCRYGIAVLETLSDLSGRKAKVPKQETNPNVALELGYMIRAGRRYLLLKEANAKIQTDLIGHLWKEFTADDPESIRRQIRIWCENTLRLHRVR